MIFYFLPIYNCTSIISLSLCAILYLNIHWGMHSVWPMLTANIDLAVSLLCICSIYTSCNHLGYYESTIMTLAVLVLAHLFLVLHVPIFHF